MAISEHSDALSPAPRPRVEGEAVTEARVRAIRAALWEGIGYAVNVTDRDVDDLAADWLRLTAEVERLRGVADRAINHGQSAQQYGDYEAWRRSWQVFRDEISLPTPAPEGTE